MEPNFDIWKKLVNYRPPTGIQSAIKQRGPGWLVHRIEDAKSYLNLDYHSLRITRLPCVNDQVLTRDDVFREFKKHLVSRKRGSCAQVAFVFAEEGGSLERPGALLNLEIRPHSIASFVRVGYCKDIAWLADQTQLALLEEIALTAMSKNYVDHARIVVTFSEDRELRVSTVRGPSQLDALFSFRYPDGTVFPGDHPVAGNRGFGYSIPPDDEYAMVLYTIGADRLNDIAPGLNDVAATWGYCSAEIFWRQLMLEFSVWITANKGAVTTREPRRHKLEWGAPPLWDPQIAGETPWK